MESICQRREKASSVTDLIPGKEEFKLKILEEETADVSVSNGCP